MSELPKIFHRTFFKNFYAHICYTQKRIKSSKIAKKFKKLKYSTKTEKNGDLRLKTDGNGRNRHKNTDEK